MLFNSYIFILFFLPVSLVGYFGLNRFHREKTAKIFLILMSLWFYAYFQVSYLTVILGSVFFNYLVSRGINRMLHAGRERSARALTAGGILVDVGIIFYFKYFDFFLDNINHLTGASLQMLEIVMPLGISFFTFQQISYLADSLHGETADYGFIDYTLFVTFFPQLIAGPIVTHDEMVPQFRDAARKRLDQEALARGLYCFTIGLGKKVLIADMLGQGVDWGYANIDAMTAADTLTVALLYTFQLYFDFSGYCDMAVGIAQMFRIELPVNFNSPYKALSIADFWDRWHITLSRFFQKYLYFPLGGSRRGMPRTIRNVMVVFLVSGLWHGANWTFVLWGGLHGLVSVLYRVFHKPWDRLPAPIRWIVQFGFVCMAFMLFRADSVSDYAHMWGNLLHKSRSGWSEGLCQSFSIFELEYLREHILALDRVLTACPAILPVGLLAGCFLLVLVPENCCARARSLRLTAGRAAACAVLLAWCVCSLSGVTSFLYFNF